MKRLSLLGVLNGFSLGGLFGVLCLGSVVLAQPSSPLSGPSVSDRLIQAEQAYQNAQYNEVVSIYSSVVSEYPQDPNLLYNLGNAYFKADQLANAIVSYRRAQRFAPHDGDVVANLALVRGKVIDKVTDSGSMFDLWVQIVSVLTLNGWLWIGLVCGTVWVGAMLAGSFNWQREINRLVVWSLTVVLGIWVVCIGLKYHVDVQTLYGVILPEKVSVRTGPAESLDTQFFVHEGVEFRVLKQVKGWTQIVLQNGLSGWVTDSEIEII